MVQQVPIGHFPIYFFGKTIFFPKKTLFLGKSQKFPIVSQSIFFYFFAVKTHPPNAKRVVTERRLRYSSIGLDGAPLQAFLEPQSLSGNVLAPILSAISYISLLLKIG
jgi:hypothetical protein